MPLPSRERQSEAPRYKRRRDGQCSNSVCPDLPRMPDLPIPPCQVRRREAHVWALPASGTALSLAGTD